MANKPTKDTGVKTPVAPKPTHILRYIDKVNHETGDGPEPKSNDWYHKKHPYHNIDNAKSEIQNPKPKIVKSPIGNIKIISDKKESWDQELKIDADTKRHVMKQDYEARKYNKPMSSSAAILREIISDKAKAKLAEQKATKPVEIDYSNHAALKDLEDYHQSQIEANERARRYHEYIKKTQDADLHRGLAAIIGSIPSDFNK